MKRLTIGFLLGSPRINGGTYVIYEHATRLRRNGHRVVLITKKKVEVWEHSWHSSAHELEWLTIEQSKVESFDIVIATWGKALKLQRILVEEYPKFLVGISQ